ncbi:MAG: hypothetical protein OWR52_13935, partial [Acidibacillus sp.]|nr:hypothetical protein [Acidibacillus sp.]
MFNVYKNKNTHQVYIASFYKGRAPIVLSLNSTHMIIKNFTGAFVVMGVPDQGGPFYALNLITGKFLNPYADSHKYSHLTSKMAECYPCVGADGANFIIGLSQRVPFKNKLKNNNLKIN